MKWEYKVAEGTRLPDDDMNAFGAEGWELVSVIYMQTRFALVFKRPKVTP